MPFHPTVPRSDAPPLKHGGSALSGVFPERRVGGFEVISRALGVSGSGTGGWDRWSNIRNGFDYRFNGLRSSFGSDNDLLLLGYGRDSRFFAGRDIYTQTPATLKVAMRKPSGLSSLN